jgi:hypothetical protein
MYTETSILAHFDPHLNIEMQNYYPRGRKQDIHYHFWLDLEAGYCDTAGSRIHLYADDERWAVVAEKSGYQNRGARAEIELYYFGNCIDYPVNSYSERDYIANMENIELISQEEWDRISNQESEDMETFEVISPTATYVMVKTAKMPIEQDVSKYRALGIHSREDAPHLVSFADLLRYYHDTSPDMLRASEPEIRQHIPGDLRKLMTIDDFHFSSTYADDHNPSQEEMYRLIAKILVTKDPSCWKPTLPANNHWSKWQSGHL